ncbi:MAG TPA: chromate resistance protein ChrB domain-containing protein [Vicinamibacterales bacterium]|nr:chromate resistance protein ChrB domain-containing protein [Vicinamibacterales bacterium]
MNIPRWLLLAHQLPTVPSNARVKTWRHLQRVGAVPTRNSVYVLPNSDQCREDFEWIRSEIVALGGEATVFVADELDPGGREDIVRTFRQHRDADYKELKQQADQLLSSARRKGNATVSGSKSRRSRNNEHDVWRRGVRTLRERFSEVERIDFFGAPGKQEAARSLAALERATADDRPAHSPDWSHFAPTDFHHRRWVTRPRPGVDRMSTAWLIRRFIDPTATFAFVDRPTNSDVPFDMYTGDFSHQGSLCTFEVVAARFDLGSPAVARIGHIVHDLDMKEARYSLPEAPAIGRLVDGLRQMHPDDLTLLEDGIGLFEALARSFETSSNTPTAQAPRTTGKAAAGTRRTRKPSQTK